jgi:hypothetical protein
MSYTVVGTELGPLVFFVCVWSAFIGFIFERLLHAIVYFLVSGVTAAGGSGVSVKRLASMEVLKEGISGVFETVHGVVQGVGTFLVSLLSSWVFIITMLFLIFCSCRCNTRGLC